MQRLQKAAWLSFFIPLLVLASPPGRAHAFPAMSLAAGEDRSTGNPPAESAAAGYVYVVQRGDTLWGIAAAHGISTSALIAANGLANPGTLRPGQALFVPAQAPAVRERPRAEVLVLATAPLAPAPAGTAAPAEADPEISAPSTAAQTLLDLMNQKRGEAGLPGLVWSEELAQAAQAHAEDCARSNRGSHAGSDGSSLETRLSRTGLTVRSASENWAYSRNASRAFALWWNEAPGRDPHRRNILNSKYTLIGIGVAPSSWGTYFVADFASP